MKDKIFELSKIKDCICCITPDNGGSWISGIFDTIDYDVYGIIYDPNIATASSACVRVSYNDKTDELFLVNSHVNLPAHHFRRCVMDDLSTRHVNYYLDENDSTKKIDGTDSILTGEDGDVMVEIPITYWRAEYLPDGRILYLVSLREFDGSEPHPFFYVSPDGETLRTQYVGAFKSVLCNESGIPLTTDINAETPASFSLGYKARSIIGAKPWTNMTLSSFRMASSNNGGYVQNSLFKQFLQLMMYIEGNTLNTQTSISNGFLYAKISSLREYQNMRLTGRTVSFGNGVGNIYFDPDIDISVSFSVITIDSVSFYRNALLDVNGYYAWSNSTNYTNFTLSDEPTVGSTVYIDSSGTVSEYTVSSYSVTTSDKQIVQFSYRGIENPYGESWEYEDGVMFDTLNSLVYHTSSIDKYAGYPNDYSVFELSLPKSTSWVKSWDLNTFYPKELGGGDNYYMCDLFYSNNMTGRVVFRGASTYYGYAGGISCIFSSYSLGSTAFNVGSRISC